MTCTPALNFVANGPAGKLPVDPPDPDPPLIDNSPTFSQSACDLLGTDLCAAMDPLSSIDDMSAVIDAIDTLATAQAANLDAILLELDSVVGTGEIDQSFDDFAGAEPGATSLLGGVTGVALPALGTVPILSPDGLPVVTVGAPPSQGGEAHAGSAPYELHVPIVFEFSPTMLVGGAILTGPNPPFVKVAGFAQNGGQPGTGGWDALVEINPVAAGTFSATIKYSMAITFTGINTIVHYTIPVLVVVQP